MGSTEGGSRRSLRDINCATMNNSASVSSSDGPSCSGTSCSASGKERPPNAIQPQSYPSTSPEVDPDGLQIVRMSLQS